MKCQEENAKNAQKNRKNEWHPMRSQWIFGVYQLLVLNCFSGISCDFLYVRNCLHLAKRMKSGILFGKLHKFYAQILANPPKFSFPLYKFQKMYYNRKDENCVIAVRKNRSGYYERYYLNDSPQKNTDILCSCARSYVCCKFSGKCIHCRYNPVQRASVI